LQPLPEGFRAAMMRWVGLERDEAGLENALGMITASELACEHDPAIRNCLVASKLIVTAALARRESRGAHFRRDFPNASGAHRRSFMTLTEAENLAKGAGSPDLRPRAAYR
jgi:L-aspartate oxidase